MSWLEDYEREEKKKTKEAQEQHRLAKQKLRKAKKEAQRYSPRVKKLLNDIGKAYWGRNWSIFWQNYLIKYGVSADRLPFWEVSCGENGDKSKKGFFTVCLKERQGHYFFLVRCRNGQMVTANTSVRELKKALRKAIVIGPAMQPIERLQGSGARSIASSFAELIIVIIQEILGD